MGKLGTSLPAGDRGKTYCCPNDHSITHNPLIECMHSEGKAQGKDDSFQWSSITSSCGTFFLSYDSLLFSSSITFFLTTSLRSPSASHCPPLIPFVLCVHFPPDEGPSPLFWAIRMVLCEQVYILFPDYVQTRVWNDAELQQNHFTLLKKQQQKLSI